MLCILPWQPDFHSVGDCISNVDDSHAPCVPSVLSRHALDIFCRLCAAITGRHTLAPWVPWSHVQSHHCRAALLPSQAT